VGLFTRNMKDFAAISLGGIPKNDICSFMEQQNGTFIRYTEGSDVATKQLRDELLKKFTKKK